MKKTIIVFILSVVSYFSTSAQTLSDVKQAFESMPVTPYRCPTNSVMYLCYKYDQSIEPVRAVSFPYKAWGGSFDPGLWWDWNLLKPRANGFDNCILYRRFQPFNGNYYVGILLLGTADCFKKVLVTVNSTSGALIDQLLIGVGGFEGKTKGVLHLVETEIRGGNGERFVRVNRYIVNNYNLDFGRGFYDAVYAANDDKFYNVSPAGKFSVYLDKQYPGNIITHTRHIQQD